MVRGGAIVLAAAAWLAASAGSAQDGAKSRPTRPVADGGLLNNEIDDLLQRWHDRTSKVTQLYAEFKRTVTERAFKTTRENHGKARFRDPNLARMDILVNEKGEGREIFILSHQPRPRGGSGLEIRHYIVRERKITIHEFPNDAVRNAQEEGPLRLLFGIKPENAHARYSFEILKKTQDAIAIRIVPKLEEDRQEFLEAALVLDIGTFMPRRLQVRENVDTDVRYDFTQIVTNVDDPKLEVLLTDFDPPKLPDPKEWKETRQEIRPGKAQGHAEDKRPPRR